MNAKLKNNFEKVIIFYKKIIQNKIIKKIYINIKIKILKF